METLNDDEFSLSPQLLRQHAPVILQFFFPRQTVVTAPSPFVLCDYRSQFCDLLPEGLNSLQDLPLQALILVASHKYLERNSSAKEF